MMKNKCFILVIALIIMSCQKTQNINTGFYNNKQPDFREFYWNDNLDKIKNVYGEEKKFMSFKQYGETVGYYTYGPIIEYGYNTALSLGFINDKLVSASYLIISPNDEDIKHIKYNDDAYTDLQNKLILLYGVPDDDLNKTGVTKDIPKMEEVTNAELLKYAPYETRWFYNTTLINLSLIYYEEEWTLKLDFLAPIISDLINEFAENNSVKDLMPERIE
jgi:hypothetical protein